MTYREILERFRKRKSNNTHLEGEPARAADNLQNAMEQLLEKLAEEEDKL
jgi:hypothetical protein